jgi:hypothetical protein
VLYDHRVARLAQLDRHVDWCPDCVAALAVATHPAMTPACSPTIARRGGSEAT